MAGSGHHPDDGTLGEHGLVAEWHREDGAPVAPGDPLCRVTLAGSDLEMAATEAGLLQQTVAAGSAARPGDVIAILLPPGTANGGPAAPAVIRMPEPPGAPAGPAWDRDYPAGAGISPAPGEPVVVPFRARSEGAQNGGVPAGPSVLGRADMPPEPGAGIPGLPLWEEPPPGEDPARGPAAGLWAHPAALLARGAAANQDVISISTAFSAAEADRFAGLLVAAWSDPFAAPTLEDVLLATLARALVDNGYTPARAGLVIAGETHDLSVCIAEPAGDLRRAVRARNSGGDDEFERATWVLVSLAGLGVESVEPRLDHEGVASFGMGATVDGAFRVTMRFDSARISEGDAGRVLARARTLFEFPYAMLV